MTCECTTAAGLLADLHAQVALVGAQGRHTWARAVLVKAWPTVFPGRAPTLAELQIAQALAAFDGAYGGGRLEGTNNWGAVHQGFPKDGECPPGGRLFDDFDAKTQKRYPVCFKVYPSPEAGAADVLRQMYVARATVAQYVRERRDLQTITRALFRAHYFGGFRKDDPEGNVTDYALNLWSKAQAIAKELGEPLAVERGTPGHGPLAPDSPPPGEAPPGQRGGGTDSPGDQGEPSDGPGLGWALGALGAAVAIYVAVKR